MVKSKVKIKKQPEKALRKLEELSKQFGTGEDQVKVGLPKNANAYPDGTSVIMVGIVHEFGSILRNIPERSYLRSTLVGKRNKYRRMIRELAKQILDGKMSKEKALNLLGLQVQTDVRQKILDIKEPPLQHREGNPLVDTGHLLESIVFQVGDGDAN